MLAGDLPRDVGVALLLETAAASLHPQVLEAMATCLREHWGNPSSPHSLGNQARLVMQRARERIAEIHRKTGVPLSQIFGVATFYAQFRLRPVGRNVIKVCHGTACHVANANSITKALEDQLQIGDGETTPDRAFTLEKVSCLGCCSLAPVIMVNKDTHGNLKPADLKKVLKPYRDAKPEVCT